MERNAGLTCGQALAQAIADLRAAGCEQARLDAEVLLAHLLKGKRADLYAHPERPLSTEERAEWEAMLARRLDREPVAYILGYREFYGRPFLVDQRVLVPRPETEMIVERVLAWAQEHPITTLWDVGTGSGALALTLALELPGAHVIGSDWSADALAVAAANRCRLVGAGHTERPGGPPALVRCDLLMAARGPIDVLVANLPYLRTDEYRQAMPEVSRHEPRAALDGGVEGLDLIAKLLAQAAALTPAPTLILLEIGASQGEQVLALARRHFPEREVSLHQDLGGWDRMVEISTPTPRGGNERGGADLAGLSPLSPAVGEGLGVRVLPADPSAIALAAEALRRGEVVVFPTDTVYGIGAAVFHENAVQALYEIKGRPEGKAIPLLLASEDELPQVVTQIPDSARRLYRRFWPGPLTIVLPARPEVPAVVRAGGPNVAVRVPDDPVARALIRAVGAPLATTSANLSGQPEARSAAEVVAQFGNRVHWIIDGGRSPGGVPSTVVDLTVDPPAIRRHGAISDEEIEAALSQQG